MPDLKSYADELADMFLASAEELRAYWRAHVGELPADQDQQLRDKIFQLENLHDQFSAEGIAECLAKVQSNLQELTALTAESKNVLKRLQGIQQVTLVATALLDAGSAAACGDLEGTAGKLGALAEVLLKSKEPATAGAGQQTS